jgi:hypothetical protein
MNPESKFLIGAVVLFITVIIGWFFTQFKKNATKSLDKFESDNFKDL